MKGGFATPYKIKNLDVPKLPYHHREIDITALKNKNPTIFILYSVMNLDHNSAFLEVFVERLIQPLSRP